MPAGVEVERLWCEWAPWWAPRAGGRSACPEARYLWGKGWGWAPWWAHPPRAEVPAAIRGTQRGSSRQRYLPPVPTTTPVPTPPLAGPSAVVGAACACQCPPRRPLAGPRAVVGASGSPSDHCLSSRTSLVTSLTIATCGEREGGGGRRGERLHASLVTSLTIATCKNSDHLTALKSRRKSRSQSRRNHLLGLLRAWREEIAHRPDRAWLLRAHLVDELKHHLWGEARRAPC
jgi:hypothetical protein